MEGGVGIWQRGKCLQDIQRLPTGNRTGVGSFRVDRIDRGGCLEGHLVTGKRISER